MVIFKIVVYCYIEYITTKIRFISGSNSDLFNKPLNNYKKLYDINVNSLSMVPGQSVVEKHQEGSQGAIAPCRFN